jgi:hypothetical protein
MEIKYQCSKCLNYKFENEFIKNRCNANGISYMCKECLVKYVRCRSYICECGSKILNSSKYRHRKTIKHINYNNNEII